MMLLKSLGPAALALALFASTALAGEIVLNSDQSDPAPKKAMEELIANFQKANPDITVKWNNFDHEGYKSAINNFLKANPPDVAAWYAGNRMAPQVKAGLFEDVTDVWDKNGLNCLRFTVGQRQRRKEVHVANPQRGPPDQLSLIHI